MSTFATSPGTVGRYAIFDPIASGGMATVHLGRLLGAIGFSRTVAIKRMHADLIQDPDFVAMFLDEARLASRVRHPNVVAISDVVSTERELFLVMEYVEGESLSRLLNMLRERREAAPIEVAVSIAAGVLHGLHAAHEAVDERGGALGLVHRDVSPQNVVVGVDGVARLIDFGIAKAASRMQTTRDGNVKGKLAYMSPEQLRQLPLDRRSDVFAASAVLWELLVGRGLFAGSDVAGIVQDVLNRPAEAPRQHRSGVPPALDEVVLRGLAKDPAGRWESARAMAQALEAAVRGAPSTQVGDWVGRLAEASLRKRAELVSEIELWSAAPREAPEVSSAPRLATELANRLAERQERADAPTGAAEVSPTAQGARVRRWLTLAGLAAAAGVALAVWASAAPAPGVVAAPSGPAAAAATAPAVAPANSVASPPTVVPSPAPAPSSVAAQKDPGHARPAAAARRSACDPPYTWDEKRGVKVFKERCFK